MSILEVLDRALWMAQPFELLAAPVVAYLVITRDRRRRR